MKTVIFKNNNFCFFIANEKIKFYKLDKLELEQILDFTESEDSAN